MWWIALRLLMLNPFFYPYSGGTEKHLHEVTKRLSKKYDVTVLTAKLPNTKRLDVVDGVRVVRMPSFVLTEAPHPIPPPIPVYLFPWPDFVREIEKADVVHIHNRFAYSPFELLVIKKVFKKKLAVTLHNARPQGIDAATDFVGGLYDDVYGKRILTSCNAIAGVSQNTLDMTVPKGLKIPKKVIYNGVDTVLFNPKNSGEALKKDLGLDDKKVVLTVCRLVEQKGIDFLLEAIPAVDKALKGNVHFILLGRGPRLEHLQAKARALGVDKKISFLSERFSEKDLASLYAACDCFVLPSLWEPFGMVVVEAMSTGKPVVATDIGGIPEIIESGKNGLLVPPRNAALLAEKISFVLQDEKAARQFGDAGRKRVLAQFTWDETARSYEKFYTLF